MGWTKTSNSANIKSESFKYSDAWKSLVKQRLLKIIISHQRLINNGSKIPQN